MKKKRRNKEERKRRRGLSILEKRSFTVVDATMIRNGTFSVATLTTTIPTSLQPLIGDKPLREMPFV